MNWKLPLLSLMSHREWRFFGVACLLKLGIAALLVPGGKAVAGSHFALVGGDTFSYLDPVENLFRHGIYAQDLARLDTYAGRMPGYGAVYGALRLVAGPGGAADGVIVLQLLLSLVSLYCLGRLAQAVTRQPAAFAGAVLLGAASTFTTAFDVRLLSESFATSALVIGIYRLYQAHRHPSNRSWLGAGGWLAWAVFLRPFLAPLLGLLVAGYAVQALLRAENRGQWRWYVLRGALLALPFLVADAAWMARNWPWYRRLVPLQSNAWAGYQTAPGLKELTGFMGAIGEEPVWWQPASDMAWFYQPASVSAPNFLGEAGKLAPPAYTYDSLRLVRHRLATAQDSLQPLPIRQAATAKAAQALVNYTRAYQRLRPFRAYVWVPLKLAYRLTLAHPGDYLFRQPFGELSSAQKLVKIIAHLWYLVIIGLGILGVLLVGWQRRSEVLLVKATPVYLIILLCFVLHQVEFRYFAVAYPFVVIGTVNLVAAVTHSAAAAGRRLARSA